MAGFLRENSRPAFLSIALHGLIVVALLFATDFSLHRANLGEQPVPIDATVVDSRVVRAAIDERNNAARSAAQARLAAAAQAAARQQQLQAQQQQLAQQERLAQQQLQAQHQQLARQQAAAAEHAQAIADARVAREASTRAAAAAARTALARHAAEAHAQRRAAAATAKRAAEAKALAAARARAAMQTDLQRQVAAEEHADEVARGPLADEYRAALQNRIIQAWIKPPAAHPGIDCLVQVSQVPGGEVTSARVTQCNGDSAVRQSIQNAVYRASPLPTPPDPSLFHRTLILEFKPNE
ncbi:MAG TPA: cell envelope integrity protein TolA [Steroidobacteraceae bacterium]|nr:cell envelope integrity protein TolA [Steroidobacteraceae bacterium]